MSSSNEENKSVKMDMRNVVSWLVPNDPSPKSKAMGKKNKPPLTPANRDKAIINKPKSTTSLASSNNKNQADNRDDNKDDISDTSSISHSFFDPDARLWSSIFSNVNRSIDELYYLCEEENAQQRCQEAVDLLERSRVDFVKLIERIDEQEKFSTDVASNDGKIVPRAMSWEVRKPTVGRRFSPHSVSPNSSRKNSFVSSPLTIKPPLDDEVIELDIPKQLDSNNTDPLPPTGSLLAGRNKEISTKLRAGAPAFIPLPTACIKTTKDIVTNESISEGNKLIKTPQQSKSSNNLQDATSLVPAQVITRPRSQSNLQSASTNIRPRSLSTSNLKSAASTFPSSSKQNLIKKIEKPAAKKINKDNWDAETEFEVTQESEKVWREAEAWIEAEAAVEEAAWEVLFGDHVVSTSPKSAESIKNLKNHPHNNSNINYQSTSFSTSQSPIQPTQPVALFTSPIKSMSNQSSTFNSPIEKQSIMSIAEKYNNSLKSNIANLDENNLKSLESQHDNKFVKKEVNSNNSSISSTPMLECPEKSLAIQVKESSSSPLSLSPSSLSSPPIWSTPQANNRSSNSSSCGSVRSLHDKLSSPDRRRSVSPGEAKRRQEAKQLAAEYNRDRSLDERKQKALISWNRVKLHSEKEVQRLADAQQSLADRLNDAEKRHADYIKLIKGKAGNENAKVSEVAFINSLNTDGIAQELQSKLEEIEARILAAEMRRQERLEGITVKKKEKSSRKSMQMTTLRYKLEQDKMDRWSKLQTRLNTVNQRREIRIAEIKRRHDQSNTDQSDNNTNSNISSNPPMVESTSSSNNNELNTIIEIPPPSSSSLNKNKVIKKDKKFIKHSDKIDQSLAESNKNDDENLEKALRKNSIYSDRPLVWSHIKNWKINRQKKGALNSRIAALSSIIKEVDNNKTNDVSSVLSQASGESNRIEIMVEGEISQIYVQLNKLILNTVKENNIKSIFIDVLSFMKQLITSPVHDNSSNIIDKMDKKKKLNKIESVKSTNYIFTPSFLDQIMPLLTQIGDSSFGTTENKRLVANFIKNDGILLIRLLMGTEFGFLSSDENFKLAVETGLWLNIFKVIHSCSLFSSSKDYLIQTGVAVLVADCLFISLSHLDDWTKSSYHNDSNDGSNNDSTNDNKGKKNIQVPTSKKNQNTSTIKLWPVEAKALSHQLTSIHQLLRHSSISSNTPISNNIFQNSAGSDSFEAWIWYLFASNIVSMLCKQLEYLEKNSSGLSDLDFPYTLTHNLVLVIGGIGSYLK
jgi:hypothetical protein